jgi:hypothetical protein
MTKIPFYTEFYESRPKIHTEANNHIRAHITHIINNKIKLAKIGLLHKPYIFYSYIFIEFVVSCPHLVS